jgi:hypothetical protein
MHPQTRDVMSRHVSQSYTPQHAWHVTSSYNFDNSKRCENLLVVIKLTI